MIALSLPLPLTFKLKLFRNTNANSYLIHNAINRNRKRKHNQYNLNPQANLTLTSRDIQDHSSLGDNDIDRYYSNLKVNYFLVLDDHCFTSNVINTDYDNNYSSKECVINLTKTRTPVHLLSF
jgi:hypothetical protein